MTDLDAIYVYQGNLRATILLPEGRRLAETATRIAFVENQGQICSIEWSGLQSGEEEARTEAARLAAELRPPGGNLLPHVEFRTASHLDGIMWFPYVSIAWDQIRSK